MYSNKFRNEKEYNQTKVTIENVVNDSNCAVGEFLMSQTKIFNSDENTSDAAPELIKHYDTLIKKLVHKRMILSKTVRPSTHQVEIKELLENTAVDGFEEKCTSSIVLLEERNNGNDQDRIIENEDDEVQSGCNVKDEFLDDTLILNKVEEENENGSNPGSPKSSSSKLEDLSFMHKDSDFALSSDESVSDLSTYLDFNEKSSKKRSTLKRNYLSDTSDSIITNHLKRFTKKRKSNNSNMSSDLDTGADDKYSNTDNISVHSISVKSEHLKDEFCDEIVEVFDSLTSSDNSFNESDSEHKKKTMRKKKVKKPSKVISCSNSDDDNDRKPKISDKEKKNIWRLGALLRENLSPNAKKREDGTLDRVNEQGRKKEQKDSSNSKDYVSKDKTIETPLSIIENELLMEVSSSSEDSDRIIVNMQENEKVASSLEDSGIKIVNMQENEPVYINDSESETRRATSTKKPGRRNIRAVISDTNLQQASQQATVEEAERIKRLTIKNKLTEIQSAVDDEFILDIDPDTGCKICVNKKMAHRLKKHQKEGVKFMWNNCYESVSELKKNNPGSGCILAHMMGLGKSFQVITLIHTLFKNIVTNTNHVVIVCPLSTALNWVNECNIAFNVAEEKTFNLYYDGCFKGVNKRALVEKWYADLKGLLILGYEAFEKLTNNKSCADKITTKVQRALLNPGPDLVICDEGHMLKNKKSVQSISLMKVTTKRRIILTGTPLQNNLREYYHMVQFVKPNLLGSYNEYTNRFVNPITNGQYDDSTEEDILFMKKRSHVLHKLLKNTVQRYEISEMKNYLPDKLDYVLFVHLKPTQRVLYKYYVDTYCNNEQKMRYRFFNHNYTLQMICVHPYLLQMKRNQDLKRCSSNTTKQKKLQHEFKCNWWKNIVDKNEFEKIDYGPKLKVMFSIIEECEKVGDKILIFSANILELDIFENFLKTVGTQNCRNWLKDIDYLRMDGSVTPVKRDKICQMFNEKNNKRARVFLVSLKVGGVGLNLVAANRVILMDVNWNPAHDSQSIFRTYRLGQNKKCVVYRLVALGTMEEVIYERSVTKLAVARRVVDDKQISRHFKSCELQEMFRCKEYSHNERPLLKKPEDEILASVIQKHNEDIFRYHIHQDLLEDKPDEELNDHEMQLAWDEFKKEKLELAQNPTIPLQQNYQLTLTGLTDITNTSFNRTCNIQNTHIPCSRITKKDISKPVLKTCSRYVEIAIPLTNIYSQTSNNKHLNSTKQQTTNSFNPYYMTTSTPVCDANKNNSHTFEDLSDIAINTTNSLTSNRNSESKDRICKVYIKKLAPTLLWPENTVEAPAKSNLVEQLQNRNTREIDKFEQSLLVPTKWIPTEQDNAAHFREKNFKSGKVKRLMKKL